MKNLKDITRVYCDGYTCMVVDSFEGLPPYFHPIENDIKEVGSSRWKEQIVQNWTHWKKCQIDDEVQKLYDKYGVENRIIPVFFKDNKEGYMLVKIQWKIDSKISQ